MNILKLEDIKKLELGKFMHRAHSKQLPENFENHFTRIENMLNFKLRSVKTKTFFTKSTNTEKYRNWLTNSGIQLWKDLNPELKSLPYKRFAKQFKNDILVSY